MIDYSEWTVWGTYIEDAVFCHELCGYTIYTEINLTLQDMLDKIAEHIKEKHENPA